MVQLSAKYDGKVLIPAEPLDVPAGTELDLDGRIVGDATVEAKRRAVTAAWDGQDEWELMRELERIDPIPPGFVRRPRLRRGTDRDERRLQRNARRLQGVPLIKSGGEANIDTQALLWFFDRNPKLTAAADEAMRHIDVVLHVSYVSI